MNEFILIRNIRIKISSIVSYTSNIFRENGLLTVTKVFITDVHGVVSFAYSNPDDAFKLISELYKLFVIKPL